MSQQFNADGSVTFTADDGSVVPLVLGKGWTGTSLSVAYQAYQNTWSLAYWQTQVQAQLDATLNAMCSLVSIVQTNTAPNVTGLQFGTFLANIANNYQALRAAIAASQTVQQVQAITVTNGWPQNVANASVSI